MEVRYFIADSIQNAMAQVKNVLGRDAIILHTRTFRKGGILGFFSKEKVEVMAAIDTPVAAIEDKALPPLKVIATIGIPVATVVDKEIKPPHPQEDKSFVAVQHELTTMRNLLEQVLSKEPQDIQKSYILDLLIKNDIDKHIAEQIIRKLPVDHRTDGIVSPELTQLVIGQLTEKLQCIEGIEIPKHGRKIVAFIGPTGVGKTTTIAKLAAKFAIQDGYKVTLVTADTYRISAVEQLKTYSDIMGIDIHVVYTANELKRVLGSNPDKQLILIDTAGRSQHNSEQITELQNLLQVDNDIEKYLVLSATTNYKDALDIVENFSVCAPDKIIFTKVDEARNIGTIVNLLYQFPIRLSYLTSGQNVPDDIELVDPSNLAQLILRD